MSFRSININEVQQYQTPSSYIKHFFSFRFVLKCLVLGLCLTLVILLWGYVSGTLQMGVSMINKGASKMISTTLGTPMETDNGQINIMLIGHGGGNHRGAYLADTIIIASLNPQLGALTMLSVPRDLYIKQGTGSFGRINGLFEQTYYNHDNNIDAAAHIMMAKLTQITGIPLSYYAVINFKGFEELIDSFGGIRIHVPETLVDRTYPKDEYSTMTIRFESGTQIMDGKSALQYARSRHSTSDFSRSYRQQQVIQALLRQLTSLSNIAHPSTLSRLYNTFTSYIATNITLSEMLSMAQYIYLPRQMFSFVYSSDCIGLDYTLVDPGCLLYSPEKAQFGGAAVILPVGASYHKLQNYEKMQDFAHTVIYNQGFLQEKAKIHIFNSIDKQMITGNRSINGVTNRLAGLLKMYAFDIQQISNSEEKVSQTTIILHGDHPYEDTLKQLSHFLPQYRTIRQAYEGSGDIDISILLGADYVNTMSSVLEE